MRVVTFTYNSLLSYVRQDTRLAAEEGALRLQFSVELC